MKCECRNDKFYARQIQLDKQIVLKHNNSAIKELCGICNDTMKNSMPIGAFLEGTYHSVCDECLEVCAPDILKAKRAYYDSIEFEK